jgi:hypothetical protein
VWGVVVIGGWIALRAVAPDVIGQLARLSP